MLLTAVVVLRILPWTVRAVGDLRETARQRVETLARARAVLATAPALRDSLSRSLGGIVALAPRLVDGRSGAEAQATLAALVSVAASRHALKVVRLDPLPDSSAGVFQRVTLHAELEGDVLGLTRFLRAIETGDPLLTLPALTVLAPDPEPQPGAPEVLRIEATVAGLYLPRGGR